MTIPAVFLITVSSAGFLTSLLTDPAEPTGSFVQTAAAFFTSVLICAALQVSFKHRSSRLADLAALLAALLGVYHVYQSVHTILAFEESQNFILTVSQLYLPVFLSCSQLLGCCSIVYGAVCRRHQKTPSFLMAWMLQGAAAFLFLAAVLAAYGLWYLLLLPLGGAVLFCVCRRPAAHRQQAPIAPESEAEMNGLDCSQEITFRQYLELLRAGGDGPPQPEISDCGACGDAMTAPQTESEVSHTAIKARTR